jgi:GAF domain-containing protein
VGKGVCGTAAATGRSLVVDNVHKFDGHIACDAASNAELVVPLVVRGEVVGVLDLDSPTLARFDEEDREGMEKLVSIYLDSTDLPDWAISTPRD